MINKALKRFSSASSSLMKLPFILHLDKQSQMKYIVNQDTSLKDLQNMLMESDNRLINTKFYLRDSQDTRHIIDTIQDYNLLADCILQDNQMNTLEIEIDGYVINYSMDKDQLAYYLQSPLDSAMQDLQLPHNETTLIDQLNKGIMNNIKTESMTVEQVHKAVQMAIGSLNKSNTQQEEKYTKFLESAVKQLEKLQSQVDNVEDKSSSMANNILKFIIVATIAQWIVLFYLTYTGYGWDFCEPIAYLINLAVETSVLVFFIKTRGSLGQSAIFRHYFMKNRGKLIQQKGSNVEAAIKFQQDKINIFNSRNYFLRQ